MKNRIATSLATAALLAAGTAQASLVQQDFATPGDALVTLDTSTHLEWLDLTATQDLSVDQVLAGVGGWTSSGFAYASFGQVGQLLNDAGYLGGTSDYPTLFLVADNASANAFLADFGATSPPDHTFGFFAPYACGPVSAPTTCTDYVQINANGNANQGYAIPDSGAFGTAVARPYIGSFLVRSVPEPGTVATLLCGMAMLAALARRRHLR